MRKRYNKLLLPISAKTKKIKKYLVGYELLAELNDVKDWIKSKSRQVKSSDVGRNLISCTQLKVEHAEVLSELASNMQKIEALIEQAKSEGTVKAVPLLVDSLKDEWWILRVQASERGDNLDAAETRHKCTVRTGLGLPLPPTRSVTREEIELNYIERFSRENRSRRGPLLKRNRLLERQNKRLKKNV